MRKLIFLSLVQILVIFIIFIFTQSWLASLIVSIGFPGILAVTFW